MNTNTDAIRFLEKVSNVEALDGDTLETVSMYDAVHATKLAQYQAFSFLLDKLHKEGMTSILTYLEHRTWTLPQPEKA